MLRPRYFGFFSFGFGFHAIAFALMSVVGWLTFLMPLVVAETWKRKFRRPLQSALVGGVAGSCLLMILLLSLGNSALTFPDYRPVFAGYGLCAFTIGFLATGLYVLSRNQKELRVDVRPDVPLPRTIA